MAAYLGPGLGLTDKIIDSHFDKIPTKFFDKNTYKPGHSRRQRRRESQDQSNSRSRSDSEDESPRGVGGGEKNSDRELARSPPQRDIPEVEEVDDMQEPRRIPRHSGDGAAYGAAAGLGAGSAYAAYQQSQQQQPQQRDIPPLYSHEPPRLRQEYMPSAGGDYGGNYNDNYSYGQGNPYSSQQQQQQQTYPDRDRRRRSQRYDSDSMDSEDEYRSDTRGSRPRRPAAITRRSSSYHGPRDRNDYNNSYGRNPARSSRSQVGSTSNQQIEKYNKSRRGSDEGGSGSGVTGRARNTAHKYHIQEELSDVLTTSKKGLAGGAIGAVVGGWAANKAQTAFGRGERRRSGGYETNPFLTLIGAAVGGLAIDAAVARYEDNKNETAQKQVKWDEEYTPSAVSGNRRGGGSDASRSRRDDRDRRRRSDRNGYGSD